jgi:FMN phosphatase YigB (HAD superfamily)
MSDTPTDTLARGTGTAPVTCQVRPMLPSLLMLSQLDAGAIDVLSSDLFDTVLLRDLSTEAERLDEAARTAAALIGASPTGLSALRRSLHSMAYAAVAAERPQGDASLAAICRTMSFAIGGGAAEAETIMRTEVETDIRHLAPNRRLLAEYEALRASGIRIIATTDTYYATTDVERILHEVVGPHPFARIYASCDVGLTKHRGGLFPEVARQENVAAVRILHVGDDRNADVDRARAAGWQAIHLPRSRWRRWGKAVRRMTRLNKPGSVA